MKKLLFASAILLAFLSSASAQDGERKFQKFKGEISGGYGYFPGSDVKSGFLFALEPKYGIMDQLYIGGKFETALQYGNINAIDYTYGGTYNYDIVKIYESLSITADYYFTNNFSVRPFVGVGGGVHLVNITNTGVDYSTYDGTSTKIFFGGLARVGVEIQRFRLGFEYNLNANTKSGHDEYNSTTNSYETIYDLSKNSYVAIKAGVFFGGGPRERKRRRHRD
jgi:outer membrane protein X